MRERCFFITISVIISCLFIEYFSPYKYIILVFSLFEFFLWTMSFKCFASTFMIFIFKSTHMYNFKILDCIKNFISS